MEHVYLYVHDLRSSGVVRDALTLTRRIGRDRPVILVAGYGEGHFAAEARTEGLPLVTLADAPGRMARAKAGLRLRRWLRHQPPGLLLSLGNLGHSAAFGGTRGLSHIARAYRISNEVARGDGLRGAVRARWMRALCDDAARIILVGAALGRVGLFAHLIASGKAVAIPSGVDADRAAALAQAECPHPWLSAGEDVPVVLGIGRLRPQKNFDLLIAAAGAARASRRLRLIILGGGTEAERVRLQALAAEAGLGEDVLLAGETDNVFAWLVRAHAFALPSRWEGSSLALLEALATGTPVVASRLAGDAAQVLDEGRYGRLVGGESAGELAEALLAQCGPDPVRPQNRALDYAEQAVADHYAQVVDEILAEAG